MCHHSGASVKSLLACVCTAILYVESHYYMVLSVLATWLSIHTNMHAYVHACTHTHTHTPAASSSPSHSLLSQTEELWNFLTNRPEVALTHSVTELEENLLVSQRTWNTCTT